MAKLGRHPPPPPTISPPPFSVPLCHNWRSFRVQGSSSLHPFSFLINDTDYRALNSMCLRMEEDTIPLLWILSLIPPPPPFSCRFPRPALASPIPSLQVPFLNSTSFSFNHLTALFVLFSATYSISPPAVSLSVSLFLCMLLEGKQRPGCYRTTLTMQGATRVDLSFVLIKRS